MNMSNKTQVLIVSQQSLFQQGIVHSLSSTKDLVVSGTAEVSDKVLSVLDTLLPDVVLVDIDGPSDTNLTLAHRIKQRSPNIAVIVLTSSPNDTELFQALKAQAVAYLGKDINADQLVNTIRRVVHGEHPINESLTTRPKIAEQVLHQFQELYWQSEAKGFISPLTPRETEILSYIAQGYLNKQIATELGISE